MFIFLPGIIDAEEIIARIRIPQPAEAEDNDKPRCTYSFFTQLVPHYFSIIPAPGI